MLKTVILSMLGCFVAMLPARAQEVTRLQECNSNFIQGQADSLKNLYSTDGFIILKEAFITMESEYETPVIVPLQEQNWYQFVFIGEPSSRLYEVRMYDWSERQVMYRKNLWGDVDGNVISYTYQPQFSELHMMRPVQVNKKRKEGLCGYVMLLKKVAPGNAPVAVRGDVR